MEDKQQDYEQTDLGSEETKSSGAEETKTSRPSIRVVNPSRTLGTINLMSRPLGKRGMFSSLGDKKIYPIAEETLADLEEKPKVNELEKSDEEDKKIIDLSEKIKELENQIKDIEKAKYEELKKNEELFDRYRTKAEDQAMNKMINIHDPQNIGRIRNINEMRYTPNLDSDIAKAIAGIEKNRSKKESEIEDAYDETIKQLSNKLRGLRVQMDYILHTTPRKY